MSALPHRGLRRRIALWLSPWCALSGVLAPAQAGSLQWRETPPPSAQKPRSLPWQPVLQPGGGNPVPSQPIGSSGMAWRSVPALPPLPGAPADASPPSLAWRPVAPGEHLVVTGADASPILAAGQPDSADPPQPTPPKPRPSLATPTETDPTAGGLRIAAPYIGGGVPSAYNTSGGDYFIAGTAGTAGKLRDNVDGSVNLGFGIGNPYSLASLELAVNFGSTKNFATNGGLDASISRVLITEPRFELAVGGGYLSFFSYGTEGIDTPNGYGVITASTVLNHGNKDFPQILQISVGAGGNTFSYLDAETFTGPDIGYFAAVGVELSPQFGVSVGWSGRGGNASLSYIPFPRSLPVSVNLMASDITNNSPYGTVALLTIAWGGNLQRDFGYSFDY